MKDSQDFRADESGPSQRSDSDIDLARENVLAILALLGARPNEVDVENFEAALSLVGLRKNDIIEQLSEIVDSMSAH